MMAANRAEALIAGLSLPPTHARWLTDAFARLPPDACFRGIVHQTIHRLGHDQLPVDARARFDAYWRTLHAPSPFALTPAAEALGLMVYYQVARGQLAHPQEMVYATCLEAVRRYGLDNTLIQMAYRAAEGDFFDFVRMQVANVDRWQNFGVHDLEQPRSGCLVVHVEEVSGELNGVTVLAIYEAVQTLFEGEYHVALDVPSPTTFTLEIERRR